MACISAHTGSLIFAIINLIIVTLSTALCIGGLLYWTVEILLTPLSDSNVAFFFFLAFGGLLGGLTVSLLALVFASFLVNGLIKKKPQHMKAYFVFGVVLVVISSFIIVGGSLAQPSPDPVALVVAVVVYAIYCLILHMIRYTYTQMEITNTQFGHQKLAESI